MEKEYRPQPARRREEYPDPHFPGLTKQELAAANNLFAHYLFYRTTGRGREVWTSCCHKRGAPLTWQRTETPARRWARLGPHNANASCPWCGKPATIKCVGRIGEGKLLEEYEPAAFLHVSRDGETVYVQCYWARKRYDRARPDTLAMEPEYLPMSVYRFRRGEAARWELDWGGKWFRAPGGTVSEPFRRHGLYSSLAPYRVHGWEQLGRSFLRYAGWERAPELDYARYRHPAADCWMRWLGLAALWPEQTEMLMKAEAWEIVRDYIYSHKKNAAVLRWGEKDPRRAFGLDGGELRRWVGGGCRLSVLYTRKWLQKQGMRADLTAAETLTDALAHGPSELRELERTAEQWHIPPKKAARYLQSQTGRTEHGRVLLTRALKAWQDYLTAAEALGAELWKEKNLLPADLWTAHEEATRKHAEKMAAEREVATRARLEALRAAYLERREALERRYAFALDGLEIRVPRDGEEIRAEGRALCHCVGGYAEWHLRGATTILFLRRSGAPEEPFLTIEMDGTRLVQIHGYKNEGAYSAGGRIAPDPRETYREWLDAWLGWVKAGSRRNKRTGKPALPKKKAARGAA